MVVALGNPGREYANTRHNAGWMVADRLTEASRPAAVAALWQPEQGQAQWMSICERGVILLKPLTYMNLSGSAVLETARHFGLSPREMLVVCDDLDLPCGAMRYRNSGSSGGHRGLASIIQCLQTTDFPRLRVGIGRPEPGSGVSIVDYVLAPWVSAVPGEPERAIQCALQVIRLAVAGRSDAASQLAARCGKGGQVQCQQQSGEDKSVQV